MDESNGHTINLANSIIGVGILAMPYCFRQCGIILSIVLLLISSIISRLACHFLLKSAILARRRTFEFLAFHIFGTLGKFSIEIGVIGFLLGTCTALFVVMADLAPALLSDMTGVHISTTLRNSTLVALAVFCVLPLGLLKNVDSLHGVSTATIGFYCCLVLKIMFEAFPHLFLGDWVSEVVLWRPAGVLQCLPIFSMALFCQTQLFEIYQAVPNASLEKMNGMIRVAVNMCTWVYIFVGAFGYIAFFQKPFTGNILISFTPSIASNAIKMGFVMSLVFTFPLVIFPCRASLYSLLYKGSSYVSLHETPTTNYIPEGKFKMLTVSIIAVSLVIALMIPSIELVLGLIGSTIGVMICALFPVTCFICISPKNTNERILAQTMLFVGVIVMVLGTYANLQAIGEAELNLITEKAPPPLDIIQKEKLDEVKKLVIESPVIVKSTVVKKESKPPDDPHKIKEDIRHEPPQPEEPIDNPIVPKTEPSKEPKIEEPKKAKEIVVEVPLNVKKESKSDDNNSKKENVEINARKPEEVDIEAIKKEEKELKDQEVKNSDQVLIDTIQKQNEVQKELVKQQQQLIEVIQKQQKKLTQEDVDKVNEQKVKAVKQIEDIAKKAIASISGQGEKDKISSETPIQKNDTKQVPMVPLPIVLAKLHNETKLPENKTNPEIKAMRRDILSDEQFARIKREVDPTKLENLNKAVKEVCNEATNTERPVIKMLCKLSEPNLAEAFGLTGKELPEAHKLQEVDVKH